MAGCSRPFSVTTGTVVFHATDDKGPLVRGEIESDGSFQLTTYRQGDGAAPHNLELARRKAYTARTFGRTSLEWAQRTETQVPGQRQLTDVIPLQGGVPIKAGTETIGAIGVSGAPGGDKDEACADAGIAKVADKLK